MYALNFCDPQVDTLFTKKEQLELLVLLETANSAFELQDLLEGSSIKEMKSCVDFVLDHVVDLAK